MSDSKLISVVIPAYNEENGIGSTLDKVKDVLTARGIAFEVLVVNDGSTDATARIAAEKGATVISHPYNIGNGASVKTGLRNAKGDLVVLLDADGQHPPETLPELLKHIPEYDMVVGARVASSHASLARRWGNNAYNRFASVITGREIEDLTSGYRVIKSSISKKFIYLLPNGFSYPTTITMSLLRAGYSLKYVHITARRRHGKSKLKTTKEAARFFLIILKVATLFSPFRVFLPISFASLTMGLVYGSYMLLVHHRFSNMVLLLLTTGLFVFLMGLIAEQIAMLRLERSDVQGK